MNLIDEKKYFELLKKAGQLDTVEKIEQFLGLMREAYSLQHVFFSVLGDRAGSFTVLYGTYPEEWKDYYTRHDLARFDPILKRALLQSPVHWGMVQDLNEDEKRMMRAREAQGIGPNGLTIPLMSTDGYNSMLSLTGGPEDDPNWSKRALALLREFREIGMIVHAAFLKLRGATPPPIELSPRHIDCLMMIGHGMGVDEIAKFQGLSQRSTKNYITELRKRLRARNNAQALYNAVQMGLIEV